MFLINTVILQCVKRREIFYCKICEGC